MGSLRVITPGMLTTIQDYGRWGWQSFGVPVAGPMDSFSHRLANSLVGNAPSAATLEITLAGPEIEFENECLSAVAGAEFEMIVDGRPQPVNEPFDVRAGSVLQVGASRRGARAYLAVAGGIDVPPVLNSRATHLPSAMGGLDGRALKSGDRLPLLDGRRKAVERARSRAVTVSLPAGSATVRVLPGPQRDRFISTALDVLQSAPYVVDQASNRMGYRLRGLSLDHTGSSEMLSEATPLGVLQVPAGGQPILLMADRQTTGGYPNIATVISADIRLAGQLAPGDSISFVVSSVREAMTALIAQERALMAVDAGGRR